MARKSDGVEQANQHEVYEDIRSPKPKHQRKFIFINKTNIENKCVKCLTAKQVCAAGGSFKLLKLKVGLGADQEPVTKCGNAGQSLTIQPDNMHE